MSGRTPLLLALALSACGASPPPATTLAQRPCQPSSYLPRQVAGPRTGTPDPPPIVTTSGTALIQAAHAVGLAIADGVAAGHCPQPSTITTTGVPNSTPEPAPIPDAPPLAFAAIDEGHFACRSASGLDDLIVSETVGDAAETCEELTGEPCVCTPR